MMNCNTGSNTHNNNNKIHFDSLLVFFSSPVYFFDRIFHFFFLTFTAIVWFETAPASQLFAFCVFGWVLFAFCQWAHEIECAIFVQQEENDDISLYFCSVLWSITKESFRSQAICFHSLDFILQWHFSLNLLLIRNFFSTFASFDAVIYTFIT